MARDYSITEIVGRPKKYTHQDFLDIIDKTMSDEEFAKKFNVSVGTISGIRSNQSKKLNISTKDKYKNQTYGGKKMSYNKKYNNNKYHRKYEADNKDVINERRRERYKHNTKHILKQKAALRKKYKQAMEGTKMPEQNNGPSAQLAAQANGVELIDHVVNIDEYVKVTLSIPKTLTAVELKGIMIKANQLLKMSEITVGLGAPKQYKPRRPVIAWTDNMMQELIDNIAKRGSDLTKSKVMRTFAQKHSMQMNDVSKRYYYLMGNNLLPKASK